MGLHHSNKYNLLLNWHMSAGTSIFKNVYREYLSNNYSRTWPGDLVFDIVTLFQT